MGSNTNCSAGNPAQVWLCCSCGAGWSLPALGPFSSHRDCYDDDWSTDCKACGRLTGKRVGFCKSAPFYYFLCMGQCLLITHTGFLRGTAGSGEWGEFRAASCAERGEFGAASCAEWGEFRTAGSFEWGESSATAMNRAAILLCALLVKPDRRERDLWHSEPQKLLRAGGISARGWGEKRA